MTNLLEMHDIRRRVNDSFALDGVSLTVGEGEVVGFVGANGAGKTTTIRAALGLLSLDSGELSLFGNAFGAHASSECQRDVRSRVGVVLDGCPFPRDHTVRQSAACVSAAYGSWDQARFERLCAEYGLGLKTKVKDLSRGMGMKLQIAVAFSHEAELLILDEATAGLDPIARDEVLDQFRAFASEEGHGVLLSSHITTDLEHIADRVVAIDGDGSSLMSPERTSRTLLAWRDAARPSLARSYPAWLELARFSASLSATFSCPIASSSSRPFLTSPAITQALTTTCTSS